MAELSTLSPSPPALAEPLPAPSSSSVLPAAVPALDASPVPKSSLYGDKALSANLPVAAGPNTSASKVTAEIAESQNVVQLNSPSPELNTAPSLYPSVQVTPNPTLENLQRSTEHPQITPLFNYVPPKTEETTTQLPPQQVQPEAQIPQVLTKLGAPIDAMKPEPPSHLTKLKPPSPLTKPKPPSPLTKLKPASPLTKPKPQSPPTNSEPQSPPTKSDPPSSPTKPDPPSSPTKPEPQSTLTKPEPQSPPTKSEPPSTLTKPEPPNSPTKPDPPSTPTKPEPQSTLTKPEPPNSPTKPDPPSSPTKPKPQSTLTKPEPQSPPTKSEPPSTLTKPEPPNSPTKPDPPSTLTKPEPQSTLTISEPPNSPTKPDPPSSPTKPDLPSTPTKPELESCLTKPELPSSPTKPEPPSTPTKPEPPSTPTKPEPRSPLTKPEQSPTVPLINEPPAASSPSFYFPNFKPRPAPDTLSYLESASLMSGTLESLSGLGEDGSSMGSDSEVNGMTVRRTDKYGFLGGNQFSEAGDQEIRVEVARQRELKWLDMFNNWDKWIKHRFQKVKLRCRKGIPSSLRSKAWQLLSNSQELLDANPGKFEELEREPGEAKWLDIIEKDLHRQFPFHEMFAARGGHGQQDLYRILKAYTIYRPDEGYCQAQAPVAAVLLMHMPAEPAFWCLVQICEKYLPGYYSAGLEAIQLDGEIFFSLLRRTCPMAYRHLKKFKIDPILYMTEWFMCIFSRTLPWACVLRVWDMFFCEGVKIVFRVGLVLLKQMLGSVDKLRELQGMYETMERLRNISPDMIREDVLVQEIIIMPVTEALIDRECNVQVRKWRESRGELTHQPGRRLQGTRAIYEYKRRAASISSGGSFSFLGSSIPPPGPLRASSSLLSLPGFRRSKANPFQSQRKKTSFSGPSGAVSPPQSPPPLVTQSPSQMSSNKPPIPPGAGQRAQTPHGQSPLVSSDTNQTQKTEAEKAPTQSTPPVNTLSPSPKIVSEQITQQIPSPTANNAPLPPCPVETEKEASPQQQQAATAEATTGNEDDGKKTKKTKEDKKKEKEDERKRLKEKREKEKAEKERLKKEKERMEKERKRGGRKKHGGSVSGGSGGAGTEDKNGAATAKDAV